MQNKKYCPRCKRELVWSDVHPDDFYCGNCHIVWNKEKVLTKEQAECNCKEFEFVCRKHGKDCKSYVRGIVEDANKGIEIDNRSKGLIKYVCKNCGREKKYKWFIKFSNEEKEEIKKAFEDKDIIEDDDMENLKKDKNKSGKENIVLAELFMTCFNYFKGNLYVLENELQNKLGSYLNKFPVDKLRGLLESYGDGNEWGSHWKEMDIKEIVNKNRRKMEDLISLFFECFGGED